MWFQDLFNYDFRRTEMCIIPYGTQMGEISFCAYNTGVGWRNIVEKMLANATLADWYREHGRHKIYAKGQAFPMPPFEKPITARCVRWRLCFLWPASGAMAAWYVPNRGDWNLST